MNTSLPSTTVKPHVNGHRPPAAQQPRRPDADAANLKLEQLLHQFAQLRGENAMLKNRLSSNDRPSSILYRAIADGNLILMAAATDGQSVGRRAMQQQTGMSRARWEWAVALLKLAGLVDPSSDLRTGLIFTELDTTRAFEMLDTYARRLIATGSAYRMLKSTLHRAERKPRNKRAG